MHIVVLGGGTGSFAVLQALKELRNNSITAIVNMTDDGGSNQVIRDEFGLLPLSDLRKSILALSKDNENELLRQIFMYRFDKGEGLEGHTLGNLIMMALSTIKDTELGAIDAACKLFAVKGKILPVTLEQAKLTATYENQKVLLGEHKIDEPNTKDEESHIVNLRLTPQVKAYDKAIDAILSADYVILGPGDLYTTTLANCIVDGIADAIANSKAKFIYITNLMSKRGQTRGFSQQNHVDEIAKYCKRYPDIILINNGKLPREGLKRYLEIGEHVISDDLPSSSTIYRADLVVGNVIKKQGGDKLIRSLLRHDKKKLKKIFKKIFSSH